MYLPCEDVSSDLLELISSQGREPHKEANLLENKIIREREGGWEEENEEEEEDGEKKREGE